MTHTTSELPLIKPDKQSFVLRANLFNVVFRLAQAHVSPTEAGRVAHVSCFHIIENIPKNIELKLKRIENNFIFTLRYVWYLIR